MLLLTGLGACDSDEPEFGAAGVILGKPLPRETTNASAGEVFGSAYDPNANRPDQPMVELHDGTGGPTTASDTIDCLSCHSTEGIAKSKAFSYGGRVYKGTAPAPNAEVIVIDGNDKLGPVKADADGFFWYLGPPVKAGAKTYARSASGTEAMTSPLGAGVAASCDSANCHVPGKQGKVLVP